MRQENIFAEQLSWMADDSCEDIACNSPLMAELTEMYGFDGALKFVHRFQGTQIYVPKLSSVVRERRDYHIRTEFTGANHFDLARRYGLSVSHVREILRRDEG